MKIKYLKKYGCYLINDDNHKAHLLNFDNNRIIQVSSNFEEICDHLSDVFLKILCDEGIVSFKKKNFVIEKTYSPTSVTFLMTTRCNLKCVYCYAYNNFNENLSFSSAKITIDYLINNAINKGAKEITIRFHGLGEPTQNFDVLKQIVEYTKSECNRLLLLANFHITSNGIMKDEHREYIQKNFDYITLSIDGTKKYQNVQRPLPNGDSFEEAIKTLYSIKNKDNLLIRTTVTNFSLENLEEWCEFLNKNGFKNINIEPVSVCGNCFNNGITDLDNKFCEIFCILCKKFTNMKISYSCFRRSNRCFHCGAFGSNMVITPFNDISTCYECFDIEDKAQSLFLIGKIKDGNICIDEKKISMLNETSLMLRNECSSCYAQTFCNGSCLSKRYKSFIEKGNSYSIVANKCKITRKLLIDKLIERVAFEISFTHSERLF